MKICYIPPKHPKKKRRSIKLYSNPLTNILLMLSSYCDRELTIIMLVCLFLAFIAAAQQNLSGYKTKAQREREKIDNELKEWEHKKKVNNMYEEKKLADTPPRCQNVNVKNLI